MQISYHGKELIKKFESFRSKAYICTAGKLTIGYGHVIDEHSELKNRSITQAEANVLLDQDINIFSAHINSTCEIYNIQLNQNQFDALMSFCFNTGPFKPAMINRFAKGDLDAVGNALVLYNKANGKPLPGLTKRRKIEQQLYFTLESR